jgi:hypothetical protein
LDFFFFVWPIDMADLFAHGDSLLSHRLTIVVRGDVFVCVNVQACCEGCDDNNDHDDCKSVEWQETLSRPDFPLSETLILDRIGPLEEEHESGKVLLDPV